MRQNKLALIVAYYLARFDRQGLEKLGFSSFRDAFQKTSEKLGVNENYIKLRRDEFDAIFPWRIGWKAPIPRQISKTIEAFQDLEEEDIYEIVFRILNDLNYHNEDEINEITAVLYEQKGQQKGKGIFIIRGPTGKQAEEFFIKHFERTNMPVKGVLRDTRDLGCGYDFEIQTDEKVSFIEVKGLSELSGGVLFTNKEWHKAKISGDSYFLALITNLGHNPEIRFIQNPVEILKATKSIYTSVQVQWAITEKELTGVFGKNKSQH